MTKLTPTLWFDTQAEEAARFYVSVFKDAKMGDVTRYGEGGPMPAGTVMTASFEIGGIAFLGLNGGPMYKFSEAVSFQIDCKDQSEVDHYWGRLTEGGEPGPCGWLKDRFGVSWQVVPSVLPKLMSSGDAGKSKAVMAAMMQMGKLDIAALEAAAEGA